MTGTAITTPIKNKHYFRPTRIAVEMKNGRARVSTLDQGHFLGGRIMQINGNRIRLAIVGIHLPLLGGDRVEIQIRVGAGVILEIVEPSGMVAYNADGEFSSWNLHAKVETDAALIWDGKEFIASQGSNAHRSTNIELDEEARLLFKETLVLGRTKESEVRLNSRIQASIEGRELLVEELNITPKTRHLPGIIGRSKVISTATVLGLRPRDTFTGTRRLDLSGAGALWRSLAPAAHLAEKETGPVFSCWKDEILEQTNSNKKVDAPSNNQITVNPLY